MALRFRLELEFINVGFYGGRKTGEPTFDTGIQTWATLDEFVAVQTVIGSQNNR